MKKYMVLLLSGCLSFCALSAMNNEREFVVAPGDDQDDEAALFMGYSEDEQCALLEMWRWQTAQRRQEREDVHALYGGQRDDVEDRDRH